MELCSPSQSRPVNQVADRRGPYSAAMTRRPRADRAPPRDRDAWTGAVELHAQLDDALATLAAVALASPKLGERLTDVHHVCADDFGDQYDLAACYGAALAVAVRAPGGAPARILREFAVRLAGLKLSRLRGAQLTIEDAARLAVWGGPDGPCAVFWTDRQCPEDVDPFAVPTPDARFAAAIAVARYLAVRLQAARAHSAAARRHLLAASRLFTKEPS